MTAKDSNGRVSTDDSESEIMTAMTDLVDAMRESAARLPQAEAHAARVRELRAAGVSSKEILATAERPLLLEIATMDLQAIAAAGTRLRRLTVRALHDDGMSIPEIAKSFGVSHQRISRLMNADPDSPGPTWGLAPSA
jgi:DNA invertase Pin-like site-specific DNA recombinase